MISIIICTYNRSESLRNTLNSLLIQEFNTTFSYEVIIIDNNSKDKTKETVESLKHEFNGSLRYFLEPNQGLSYARNRGIREAKGEIIAFTDDDVILDKNWLINIETSFSKYKADCVFGKILPLWQKNALPKWFSRDKRLWGNLALLDYGDKEKTVTSAKEQLFGANFAVKREIFKEQNLEFNVNLGRKGNNMYSGEDTELFYKLLNNGKLIVYIPNVLVYHKIVADRLTKKYFKKWHYHSGWSYAVNLPETKKAIFNIPFWFIKESLIVNLKFIYYVLSLNIKEAFRFQLKLIFICGALASFLNSNKPCHK